MSAPTPPADRARTSRTIVATAHGRLCLFGEHQDYLGLPVIAMAVDLPVRIFAGRTAEPRIRLDLPDIGERATIDLDQELVLEKTKPEYLKACVLCLRRRGWELPRVSGLWAEVRGSIPINAGCGSSSALTVAWTALLAHAAGMNLTPLEIARIAHEAEVVEFGGSGGMMDHVSAAVGGCFHLECGPRQGLTPLAPPQGFVLGWTGEPKDTQEVLRSAKERSLAAFAELGREIPGFDPSATPLRDAERALARMTPELARAGRAQLADRDLAGEGKTLLASAHLDAAALGRLLDAHHEQLATGLGLSTPGLERMLVAARAAGALGGKLNGSGGGGTVFAFAPGREAAVRAAMEHAGRKAWIVRHAPGVIVETILPPRMPG